MLHVLGYTVSVDHPSYSTNPGGSFTVRVTVTPAHGYAGDVCLDVANADGNMWPSYLSPDNGFVGCAATDENTGADVTLAGAPVSVDMPIDVTSNATPGAFPLEILANAESAPTVARSFELDLGAVNPPVISSFHPVNVGVGTHVTINGSAFTGTTAVAFNGVAASDFSVDSDNTITAIVAPGTTSGKITVTTPLGTSTSPNPYTFFAQPTITGLSVTNAAVGSTVVVNGTSLNGATSVTLHGTHAPFTVVSSAQITFTVPAGATNGTVTVVTPGGSATSSASITVGPPPTIASFSPGSGPVGMPVTITGADLGHTVGIEIGGVLTVPTSVDSTQVVFSIPPGAVSGTIKILATNGSVTSVDSFTVTG
jgi:large repetitive protein